MPYIPKQQPYVKFQRLVKGYANPPKLAEVLNCSAPTARRKLNDPRLFTLDDVHKLNLRLHVPIEELREAIQY